MRVVYILYDIGSDEIPQVIGVFSSREKAVEYEKGCEHERYDEYSIEEEKLDP